MASPSAVAGQKTTQVEQSATTSDRFSKGPSKVEKPTSGRDRLTKLPNELLDQIFDEVYRAKKPLGAICKTLFPFQRRQYRSLTAKPHRDLEHLEVDHAKALLSGAINLERLHLYSFVNSTMPLPLLALIAYPSYLTELRFRAHADGGALGNDSGAEEENGEPDDQEEDTDDEGVERVVLKTKAKPAPASSISAFLSLCTNLRALTIEGSYEFSSDPAFLPTLRKLRHLRHLTFGDETEVSYHILRSLITGKKALLHLEHLSLDMFLPVDAGDNAYRCDYQFSLFDESWRPFLDMEWPEGLSLMQLRRLDEIADDGGIVLDGTLTQALQTWSTYQDEMGQLEATAESE